METVIKAKGELHGFMTEVVCRQEDGHLVIRVDGQESEYYQELFDNHMLNIPPIGGNYYPPMGGWLAAFSILQNAFFDLGERVKMDVEGDIGTIPFDPDPDIVY